MEGLKVVIKVIKIKVNDKPDYIQSKVSCKNYTTLEGIVLLDFAIDLLEKEFKLSNDDIWELLKDYRSSLKEVK